MNPNTSQSSLFKIIILISLFISGCFRSVGIEEMELGLNGLIGKSFLDYSKNFKDDIRQIYQDNKYNEYEIDRGDGCTFSFLVDKKTWIIKSWRITSSKSECERRVYVPNV